MRVNVWLVVLSVGVITSPPMVDQVQGAPRDPAPVSEAVHAPPAIVTEAPRNRLAAPQVVNVRVYRAVGVTVDALQAALNVAEVTFAAASVVVAWKVCGPADCNTPLSPAERVVRMVRSPKGGSRDARALGEALIDSQRGTGVLATVYVDRVVDLARRLAIDHPRLLGRTIAHEIGHLLLATNSHGTSGLMREVWSLEELVASRADDWILRPVEADAIRQRLMSVAL